jgi:hypothetical protein
MRRRLIALLFSAALGVSSCAYYQELAGRSAPAAIGG